MLLQVCIVLVFLWMLWCPKEVGKWVRQMVDAYREG